MGTNIEIRLYFIQTSHELGYGKKDFSYLRAEKSGCIIGTVVQLPPPGVERDAAPKLVTNALELYHNW